MNPKMTAKNRAKLVRGVDVPCATRFKYEYNCDNINFFMK